MKTLANATRALAIVADSPEPVPVAEIATRLGLPRSSASRLMAALRDGGLIEQDPLTRRYAPGVLAWRLGSRFRPEGHDTELLTETLAALSQVTGFTSSMAVLDRNDIVLLRQHQGRVAAQFSVRLGQTLPAHATAVGKALLARLPDRTVERLFDETLTQANSQTLGSRADLIADLTAVRRRGYALSRQEISPGVVSVGGAVFGAASSCPIGLSLSFPGPTGRGRADSGAADQRAAAGRLRAGR